jgi:predicted aspartyl protease
MMGSMRFLVFPAGFALAASLATIPQAPDLHALYTEHRWPELRQALAAGEGPALYRGAVAAVYHQDAEAEEVLRTVIRAAPRSDDAYAAHRILGRMYLRNGQYRRLWSDLDERLAAFPGRTELEAERSELAGFRELPDQRLRRSRPSALAVRRRVFVRVSVDGTPSWYFVDTGAWISCMSASEARRQGLVVHDAGGVLGNSAGGTTGFRTAVARRLTIGGYQFENVSFAVFPDGQEPWSTLPEGERGILGVPLLIGLQSLRWRVEGTLEIGSRPTSRQSAEPNLMFDDDHLVATATVAGRPMRATVDTGAETTDLYAAFARQFADLVRAGTRSTTELKGVGTTVTYESIEVPEVTFVIGGGSAALRPAPVVLRDIGAAGCVGNLGLDLLTQTGAFSVDFSSMRLDLTGAR